MTDLAGDAAAEQLPTSPLKRISASARSENSRPAIAFGGL
jgi:hypothetical protein